MAVSESAVILIIILVAFSVWLITKQHYGQKLYPYCKEHRNLSFSTYSKFCPECGKPLYKKELKEIQVR